MPFLMIFQREDYPLVTGTRIVATAVASETDILAHSTDTKVYINNSNALET